MKKSNSEESKRKELAKLFIGYKLKICFVFDVGEPKKPFAKPVLKFITSWLGKGNKPDKWFLFPGEYFIKNDFNRKQAATFTPFIMLRILNKQYSDSNRRFERPADKPLGNMCQVIGSAIKSMLTNQKNFFTKNIPTSIYGEMFCGKEQKQFLPYGSDYIGGLLDLIMKEARGSTKIKADVPGIILHFSDICQTEDVLICKLSEINELVANNKSEDVEAYLKNAELNSLENCDKSNRDTLFLYDMFLTLAHSYKSNYESNTADREQLTLLIHEAEERAQGIKIDLSPGQKQTLKRCDKFCADLAARFSPSQAITITPVNGAELHPGAGLQIKINTPIEGWLTLVIIAPDQSEYLVPATTSSKFYVKLGQDYLLPSDVDPFIDWQIQNSSGPHIIMAFVSPTHEIVLLPPEFNVHIRHDRGIGLCARDISNVSVHDMAFAYHKFIVFPNK